MSLINDYIVPSIHSDSSIPSNPEARERLESLIQLAVGTMEPVPILPVTALNISNKKYKLEPIFLGWSDMTFFFEQGSEEATLKMTDSPDLKIGMDNRYRITESLNSRPVGLRGGWIESNTFYLDYIVIGDFIRSEARIKFDGDKITVTITYLNWSAPSIVLHGKAQESSSDRLFNSSSTLGGIAAPPPDVQIGYPNSLSDLGRKLPEKQ